MLLPVGFIALGKPGGWGLPGAHRLTECVMVLQQDMQELSHHEHSVSWQVAADCEV